MKADGYTAAELKKRTPLLPSSPPPVDMRPWIEVRLIGPGKTQVELICHHCKKCTTINNPTPESRQSALIWFNDEHSSRHPSCKHDGVIHGRECFCQWARKKKGAAGTAQDPGDVRP